MDVILAGHTHRIANFMVGRILVAEGLNAGASYSVVQLVVHGQDVEWAGAATRVAKNIGVAPRADVQAIVDDANVADRGPAQPGDRDAAVRHQAGPEPAERIGDGQHGRGCDAGEVPGGRGGVHELGRAAGGPELRAAERAARRPARSRGARCLRCCRSATAR